MLVWALSMVSSRCCSSPSERAVRSALSPRLSPIALRDLGEAALHRLRQPQLRRGLGLGDVVEAAVQLLLAVVQRPDRAVEVGEVPRQRLDRAAGASAAAQEDEEQDDADRRRPEPRVVGGDLQAADADHRRPNSRSMSASFSSM